MNRKAAANGAAGRAIEGQVVNDELPRVVIVGGGFAGLETAKRLAKAPVRVTLVDKRNYHLFQPLLYQVATAGLNASDIAAPIRKVLRWQQNADVVLGEATGVDLERKKLLLKNESLDYDFLVVATGATHSYFGNDHWSADAPGLKTMEDAFEIRRRVLYAFEAAERETDPERQREWLTFVVIGGGPTGVELAGAVSEIAQFTLVSDFRHIDPSAARVILVEGLDQVLPVYPEPLSEKARRQLEHLGVEVKTGARVTGIDSEGVTIGEERIPAKTVLWGAGVEASPLGAALGAPTDRAGRVHVEPDLTIPGHPEVFVAGDLASLEQDGKPVFGVAPAALQAGRSIAKNIRRTVADKPRVPFRYVDKGSLATIGRARAVASVGGLKLSGFIAWVAWLAVHIFFLIGFRNRWKVMAEWAWSYLTYERGARLITGMVENETRGLPPEKKDLDEIESVEEDEDDARVLSSPASTEGEQPTVH